MICMFYEKMNKFIHKNNTFFETSKTYPHLKLRMQRKTSAFNTRLLIIVKSTNSLGFHQPSHRKSL